MAVKYLEYIIKDYITQLNIILNSQDSSTSGSCRPLVRTLVGIFNATFFSH